MPRRMRELDTLDRVAFPVTDKENGLLIAPNGSVRIRFFSLCAFRPSVFQIPRDKNCKAIDDILVDSFRIGHTECLCGSGNLDKAAIPLRMINGQFLSLPTFLPKQLAILTMMNTGNVAALLHLELEGVVVHREQLYGKLKYSYGVEDGSMVYCTVDSDAKGD